AVEAGLRYVYTGNIHDGAGQSTYCHGCGATLIGRDWYDLTAWNLSVDGRCADCSTACAGVFDAGHGTWGRRRQSVTVPPFDGSRRPGFGFRRFPARAARAPGNGTPGRASRMAPG